MIRKWTALALVGLLVVTVFQSYLFAEGEEGAGGPRGRRHARRRERRDQNLTPEQRAERREAHRERFEERLTNLPEGKKKAVKAILKRMHEAIKTVRENDELTPEQKHKRIRAIRRKAHQAIRKILGRGHRRRRPGGGDEDGGDAEE